MMFLFEDEEQLTEHEIAWFDKDFDSVQKLADSYKEKAENELFQIMNDITSGKKHHDLTQSENYSKFWIDNALSQHVDCMMSVNVMNLVGVGLSDQAHFNYYFHSITQGKRYGKWAKPEVDPAMLLILKVLMKLYTINIDDAEMYRKTLISKGKLKDVLHKAKAMVTDDFLKEVTKNVKEQKEFKKKALEW